MEVKKNPKQDLENYRMLFVQIGLVFALVITIIAIEWKTYEEVVADLGELKVEVDDEVIPITQRTAAPPPPPPPPPPPEVIEVVEDDVELEEELEIEVTETDETEEVEVIEMEQEVSNEVLNFMVVENKPVFPGCEDAGNEAEKFQCLQLEIQKFIARNFKFPEMARQMGIQGKVYINFEISKDGSVKNVQVVRGVDELLDEEAIRVIKQLPKFTPAKQRGKPVRVQYTVPINARLQ